MKFKGAVGVLVLLWGVGFIEAKTTSFREEFIKVCPKPDWWNEVEAPIFIDENDVGGFWRGGEGQTKKFFKATYQSILKYPEKTGMVVLAINLMGWSDPSYAHMLPMRELVLKHHFQYKNKIEGPGWGDGDFIAGIVENLAKDLNAKGRYSETVVWVEKLFKERPTGVNDQLRQLISIPYAEALWRSGKREKAKSALRRAMTEFRGDWAASLQNKLTSLENEGMQDKSNWAITNGLPKQLPVPSPVQPESTPAAKTDETCEIKLKEIMPTVVSAGSVLTLYGDWEADQGKLLPVLQRGGLHFPTVVSWKKDVVELCIPLEAEPGVYRVGVFCEDPRLGPTPSSGFRDVQVHTIGEGKRCPHAKVRKRE